MALTSEVAKAIYTGDGSTTLFAIPFPIIENGSNEVKVYLRDESAIPPTENLLTEGIEYTLTGGSGTLYTDVLMAAAPSSSQKLIIVRQLPVTQTLDLSVSQDFKPDAQEVALDKIVAQIQSLKEDVKRSYKSPLGNQNSVEVEPESGKVLGFDSSGNLEAKNFTTTNALAATATEAKDGTLDNVYISPLTLHQAFSSYSIITGATTLSKTDRVVRATANSASYDITLPSLGTNDIGRTYTIKRDYTDAKTTAQYSIRILPPSGGIIENASLSLPLLVMPGESITLVHVGYNTFYITDRFYGPSQIINSVPVFIGVTDVTSQLLNSDAVIKRNKDDLIVKGYIRTSGVPPSGTGNIVVRTPLDNIYINTNTLAINLSKGNYAVYDGSFIILNGHLEITNSPELRVYFKYYSGTGTYAEANNFSSSAPLASLANLFINYSYVAQIRDSAGNPW